MQLSSLKLNPKSDARIRAGHMWIYSNEIDTKVTPLKGFEPGEQVEVFAADGKSMGVAIVSPQALICARMISRSSNVYLNRKFLKYRIESALQLREQHYADQSYRLCFGDSDGLPGLVVDRFSETLVVQISNPAMELVKDDIVSVLDELIAPATIVLKNDGKMRAVEGLPVYVEVVKGELNEGFARFTENGVLFDAPVLQGQKTGWFYDHRDSRNHLKRYVEGKRVLDVFSYIGGWGVQAAAFGADQVVCLDSSAFALECVSRNAHLNQVEGRMATMQADAFEGLKTLAQDKEKFDVVVLDPPALIARRKDIKVGERAYQKLNQLALRLVETNGVLVTASCSMHLERNRLVNILQASARQVDRTVQLLEQGHQALDHPIHPAIAETEYIKCLFARSLKSW
ncbi:class I SAM-dependent rRNA methyltransferase [Litoribacillus peritrichatus]|uniref:Class I SAM-dependent rRNA methyltransferase n=1 Tax=Litoribacillus peritrichatus TaxID=718191 RepID=A0ABP7NEP3_9GAMM